MENPKLEEDIVKIWINDHPDLIYEPASETIFCTKCETSVKATRKSNVVRHINGATHQGNRKSPSEDFYFNLIEFLIVCNIPWSQVNNPVFKKFFAKYLCCDCSGRSLPEESLLRKVYLDKMYNRKIKEIYREIENAKLWISLDETTDVLGRYMVHLIVRTLNPFKSTQSHLIACKVLEKVNGNTISKFVLESLQSVWENSFESKVNNVLIMCTDSVAYMLLAGRILKSTFPKLVHVTCLAHALHRLSEQIRSEYNNVDKVISNVKKTFLKAPSRVKILKETYPDLPLPPQPVITRWGTWLEASFYYAQHFDEIQEILSMLNSRDALSIRKAKDAMSNENVKTQIMYIEENFKIISEALTHLQKKNISITEAFEVFDTVRMVIEWTGNNSFKTKMEQIIKRNPDLDIVRNISDAKEETFLRFAPLTSVDVERSFSTYKWILHLYRNRLLAENIEKIMIIYFNSTVKDLADDPVASSSSCIVIEIDSD